MQQMNERKKEFTNQQWDDLLNQTFVDPTPAAKAPEAKAPVQPASIPPQPASKASRKRRLSKKWLLVIILSLVAFIVGLCVFLYYRFAPSKELRQCMEALQQWQSAEHFQLDISTHHIRETGYWSSSIYPPASRNAEVAVYYHSGNSALYWSSITAGGQTQYVGKAQNAAGWFAYSSSDLSSAQWKSTADHTPISRPWILTYSLDNVRILYQFVEEVNTQENFTHITFAVMDTDSDSELYGQGPYYLVFLFQEGQLYSVARLQTDFRNTNLIGTWFNLKALTEEDVSGLIRSQLIYPQQYPGLVIDSVITVQPKSAAAPAED